MADTDYDDTSGAGIARAAASKIQQRYNRFDPAAYREYGDERGSVPPPLPPPTDWSKSFGDNEGK